MKMQKRRNISKKTKGKKGKEQICASTQKGKTIVAIVFLLTTANHCHSSFSLPLAAS
jgi:hypothetical protein